MKFVIVPSGGGRGIAGAARPSSGPRPDVTRTPGGGRLSFEHPLPRLDASPKRWTAKPIQRRAIMPVIRRALDFPSLAEAPFVQGWRW